MTDSFKADVLIVEDDVIQCREMADYLARAGLSIQMAHDGVSALHHAEAVQPRVALLDFNLPDTTGVELAERLRASLPETAILIMSGRIDGLSEATLQKIGIKAFVNKPLPLGPLRQAVMRLVHAVPTAHAASAAGRKGWFSAGIGGARN